MDINRTAPSVSRHAVVVQAPVESVWAAHTWIDEWSRWQADITRAALAGPLASGSTFSWETAGMDTVSLIDDIEFPRRIAWHGEANGILAIHVWTFLPNEHGTVVTTEESSEGPSLPSDVSELKRALDTSLERWLSFLKARVESGELMRDRRGDVHALGRLGTERAVADIVHCGLFTTSY